MAAARAWAVLEKVRQAELDAANPLRRSDLARDFFQFTDLQLQYQTAGPEGWVAQFNYKCRCGVHHPPGKFFEPSREKRAGRGDLLIQSFLPWGAPPNRRHQYCWPHCAREHKRQMQQQTAAGPPPDPVAPQPDPVPQQQQHGPAPAPDPPQVQPPQVQQQAAPAAPAPALRVPAKATVRRRRTLRDEIDVAQVALTTPITVKEQSARVEDEFTWMKQTLFPGISMEGRLDAASVVSRQWLGEVRRGRIDPLNIAPRAPLDAIEHWDDLQPPWTDEKVREVMCYHVTSFRIAFCGWDVIFQHLLKDHPEFKKGNVFLVYARYQCSAVGCRGERTKDAAGATRLYTSFTSHDPRIARRVVPNSYATHPTAIMTPGQGGFTQSLGTTVIDWEFSRKALYREVRHAYGDWQISDALAYEACRLAFPPAPPPAPAAVAPGPPAPLGALPPAPPPAPAAVAPAAPPALLGVGADGAKPPWPGLEKGGLLDPPSEADLRTIYFMIFACIELALMQALILVRVGESLAIDSTFNVPGKVHGAPGDDRAPHLDFWCNPAGQVVHFFAKTSDAWEILTPALLCLRFRLQVQGTLAVLLAFFYDRCCEMGHLTKHIVVSLFPEVRRRPFPDLFHGCQRMQGYMVRNSPYRRSFGLDISGVVKTPHEEDLEALAQYLVRIGTAADIPAAKEMALRSKIHRGKLRFARGLIADQRKECERQRTVWLKLHTKLLRDGGERIFKTAEAKKQAPGAPGAEEEDGEEPDPGHTLGVEEGFKNFLFHIDRGCWGYPHGMTFENTHVRTRKRGAEGVPPKHKSLVGEGGKNEAWHNPLNASFRLTPRIGEVYAQAKILLHVVRRHNGTIGDKWDWGPAPEEDGAILLWWVEMQIKVENMTDEEVSTIINSLGPIGWDYHHYIEMLKLHDAGATPEKGLKALYEKAMRALGRQDELLPPDLVKFWRDGRKVRQGKKSSRAGKVGGWAVGMRVLEMEDGEEDVEPEEEDAGSSGDEEGQLDVGAGESDPEPAAQGGGRGGHVGEPRAQEGEEGERARVPGAQGGERLPDRGYAGGAGGASSTAERQEGRAGEVVCDLCNTFREWDPELGDLPGKDCKFTCAVMGMPCRGAGGRAMEPRTRGGEKGEHVREPLAKEGEGGERARVPGAQGGKRLPDRGDAGGAGGASSTTGMQEGRAVEGKRARVSRGLQGEKGGRAGEIRAQGGDGLADRGGDGGAGGARRKRRQPVQDLFVECQECGEWRVWPDERPNPPGADDPFTCGMVGRACNPQVGTGKKKSSASVWDLPVHIKVPQDEVGMNEMKRLLLEVSATDHESAQDRDIVVARLFNSQADTLNVGYRVTDTTVRKFRTWYSRDKATKSASAEVLEASGGQGGPAAAAGAQAPEPPVQLQQTSLSPSLPGAGGSAAPAALPAPPAAPEVHGQALQGTAHTLAPPHQPAARARPPISKRVRDQQEMQQFVERGQISLRLSAGDELQWGWVVQDPVTETGATAAWRPLTSDHLLAFLRALGLRTPDRETLRRNTLRTWYTQRRLCVDHGFCMRSTTTPCPCLGCLQPNLANTWEEVRNLLRVETGPMCRDPHHVGGGAAPGGVGGHPPPPPPPPPQM